MKFLIFGAGAIGSAIGARLCQVEGVEVHLVGRERHIEAIRKSGLWVRGIWGNFNIRSFHLHLVPPRSKFDAVFITVKTFSTDEAARILAERGVEAQVFISMQNGLGNYEILSRYLSPVAMARVIFGVVFENPGEIRITVWGGPILFGLWEGNVAQGEGEALRQYSSVIDLLKEIAGIFRRGGLEATFVEDIKTPIWEKTLYNSALNPLSVILNSSYGEIVDNPFSCDIAREVIYEGVKVGKMEGASLPDEGEFFKKFLNELVPPTRDHISSMIQDIRLRGKTEIDSMCGAIVNYGMKHKFFPKVNFTLWKLIKAIERARI